MGFLKKLLKKSPGMKLLKKDPIAKKVMKVDPAAKLISKTDPVMKGIRNEVVGKRPTPKPMSKPSTAVTGGSGQINTKPARVGGTAGKPAVNKRPGGLNRKGVKSFYER